MAIGSKNTFMINARTGHKQYYVGTRQAIGLRANAGNKQMLERLQRFASIGSSVRVYYLHQDTVEEPDYFEL